MEISWICISLCYSLLFYPLCNAYPSRNLEGIVADQHVQFLSGLLGVLLIVCSLVFLAGCLCCQRRNNFKEFRNSSVVASVPSDLDHGHVNPIANEEFTIFTPLSPPLFNNNLFLPREHIVTSKLNTYVYEGTDLSEWFSESGNDFPRIKLKYVKELGTGKFGKVVEGAIQDGTGVEGEWTPVVVRILDSASSHEERLLFLKDALMYRYSHPNILCLYGKCLESIPFLLLQEHCQVDLKSYLRSVFVNGKNMLSSEYPVLWSTQLTSALKHLHCLGITHQDLACRNCQLSSDLSLKLGDYSLSTSKYPSDYYRGATLVPIRWCDPKSVDLKDNSVCLKHLTSENIIWSLGVTLWEICQHGEQPYSSLNDDEVITQVLRSNLKLKKPNFKAIYMDYLYQVMQSCWRNLESRPNISQIHLMLSDILQLQNNSLGHTSDACSVSSDDFDKKWELLKPNCVVKTDPTSDSISIEMNDANIKITKPLSPSLNNLHGSLDNLLLEKSEPQVNFHFEDEIKLKGPGNRDSLQDVICNSDSSDQGSLKLNTSFNFNESTNSNCRSFIYQRTSSGSETEDENWRNKVERGAYTEKVQMKSRSVADLMVLTHVDYSESESETPLPSLDFRVNYKPIKNNLESSHTFSSEGNLLSIHDTFQEELKKLQEERKDSLLFVPDSNSNKSSNSNNNLENDSLLKEANIASLANSTKLLRELSSPERIQPVHQIYNVFNVSIENQPLVYDKSKLNEMISFSNPYKYETEVTEAKLSHSNKITGDFDDFHKRESIICDNSVEKIFKGKYENSFNVPSQLLDTKQAESVGEFCTNKLQDLTNTIDACLKLKDEHCGTNSEPDLQVSTVESCDQVLPEYVIESKNDNLEELRNTVCLTYESEEYQTSTKLNAQLYLEHNTKSETDKKTPAIALNEVLVDSYEKSLSTQIEISKNNNLEKSKAPVETCLIPKDGDYKHETSKILPAFTLNQVLIANPDVGEFETNNLEELKGTIEDRLLLRDKQCETAAEINTQPPSSSSLELRDICDQMLPEAFPNNSKLEMEMSSVRDSILVEDVNIDWDISKENLENDFNDITLKNSLKMLDDVIEAVSKEDHILDKIVLESNEIARHSDLDEINQNNTETVLQLSLADNVEINTVNFSRLDKNVNSEDKLYENVSDKFENKHYLVDTKKLGRFNNLMSNAAVLNQFLNSERNHSEPSPKLFLSKFSSDMSENVSVNEIPSDIENEIFNMTQDSLEFVITESHLDTNLHNEDNSINYTTHEAKTTATDPISDQYKNDLDKKLVNESMMVFEEMDRPFESVGVLNLTKNEFNDNKNKMPDETIKLEVNNLSSDLLLPIDLSIEPKILVEKHQILIGDQVTKESNFVVKDDFKRVSNNQKVTDILSNNTDQKTNNLISPDEHSSYDFLSCEGNLENELCNTSESLYSILDHSEFDAVRSDKENTVETCSVLKNGEIVIETINTAFECENHLSENLTQSIEETKNSLSVTVNPEVTPQEESLNQSSNLEEINFDLSANQEEAMPNSLTHSYAFTSTPMRRKLPIHSGDGYSSLNLFDSSDENPDDGTTGGVAPAKTKGKGHDNLSYSLETWDNFLDTTLDNQQHENVFDSFSSEPKSLLFVENEDIANGETKVTNNNKEQFEEAKLEGKYDSTFKVEAEKDGEKTFVVEENHHNAANATFNKEKPDFLGSEDSQDSWESGEGWFLHPQSTEEVSGEMQISSSTSDSYVGFGIDDEIMSAIRNELLSKLPHAQGSNIERIREEGDLDSQELNEVFLKYNVYNTPLSPIPEESYTEEGSDSYTPRQRADDEDSDWSDHCEVPQDTESHSTRTLEGFFRGPFHRHTPSQDSCCSNDTLFNLEELNCATMEGEKENEQLSPKFIEEETEEQNPDKTFTVEYERPIGSPHDAHKNKEAEFAMLYDSDYQNFLNKFILTEREHSSITIENPEELTGQDNFVFNKVNAVPLPSPDNNPWKQLPVSFLSCKPIMSETNDSCTDVPEYVNTVVEDLENDHIYANNLLDDENAKPVYTNCDEMNSQDLENDYDNYVNFVNKENAKNSLECSNSERDYTNIVESNKADANSEDDHVFGILTDIRFNGPTDNQLMSTSFSESNNCDEQEWDSGSDSRSSSSGEFIWKEGEHEESLKALRAAPQDVLEDIQPMEKILEDQYEGSDISSFSDEEGETPEFIPSAWDKFAMPSKSALRSPEKTLNKAGTKKAKVWFKKQKYHCIYEYPKEPESPVLQSQDLWKHQNDFKAYADWEFDGEPYSASNDDIDLPLTYNYKSRNLPNNSLYQLTDVSDVVPGNTELEEEFFVSGSSQPFNISSTSQFFPGHNKWDVDHIISGSTENATPDSGVEDITPGSQTDSNEYTKIEQTVPTLKQLASACVNKTKQVNVKNEDVLGGLRHTRNKLKLDLPPSPSAFSTEKMFVIEDNFEPLTREKPTFTTFGKSRFFVQHIDTPEDENQSRNVSFEALPYKPIEVTVTSKKESQDVQKNNAFNLCNSTEKKDTLCDEDPDIVKVKIEIVRGEASLLDSADEDSGIESSTLERKLSNL